MLHLEMFPKHSHMVKAHQTQGRLTLIKNADDRGEDGRKEGGSRGQNCGVSEGS